MLKAVAFLHREFPLDSQRLPVWKPESPLPDSVIHKDVASSVAGLIRENHQLKDQAQEAGKKTAPEGKSEFDQLIKNLLPTLDGFERVLQLGRSHPQTDQMENWLKSVESIYIRLLSMLESHGLFQLNAVGSKVDLNLQEVVEYRPSKSHEHEVVISERSKGFVFRGKLLRDAKVVVAYNEGSL